MATFPASQHHRPLTGRPTELCCFATTAAAAAADTTRPTTGVARGVRGCGPHRAALALARGGKRAKIVLKNSRENSDCII